MHRIRIAILLSFFICSFHQVSAQIFPKEGSKLCWRLIGFSFPAEKQAIRYSIEIAKGVHNTEISFEKNIVASVYSTKNKTIAEVPSFGCQYTWRTISVTHNNIKTKSALHHFSTKITPDVDTTVTRFRIIKNAEKYKDAYIFIDNARVLYDMKGKPVWFLPGTDAPANQKSLPRDLKITPQGTITFITGGLPYEITYAGDILWHYNPNSTDNNSTAFHHEFTRMRNGHYMAMKFDNLYKKYPAYKDSIAQNARDSAKFYEHIQFSNILECDNNNHVLWKWNGFDYIKNSDLYAKNPSDNIFHLDDLHENAFFFDEQNKTIYLSYKNISRIIKIKYPEGNVLNTYGTIYKPGITQMGNDLFCSQHSCQRSQKGYLYLFNNNTCSPSHLPTILMLREPPPGKTNLKKIWEYQCTVDDPGIASIQNEKFNSSGNVIELPDESLLVMMGKPYPKTFIVSIDKKILWSAIPEKYNSETKKWEVFPELYRASIITNRKDMEQLIWNSEK